MAKVWVPCPLCREMKLRASMPPAIPWPCEGCEAALKRFPVSTGPKTKGYDRRAWTRRDFESFGRRSRG